MDMLRTVTYEQEGPVARITLNRPARGNAITLQMPGELASCVERANLDPEVRVIGLAGNGTGFCAGYDLVSSAEGAAEGPEAVAGPPGSPLDMAVQRANHDSSRPWDPMLDYAMMSRNVRGFMSLFFSDKPVVCKIHGYCVAGGTDIALCCDLILIEETARIGYPAARAWGVPTTALWVARVGLERARRLLFTGDCLTGREAADWGLAIEAPPSEVLDERFAATLARLALLPTNQLTMMKLLINQTVMGSGLHAAQLLGTVLDGLARHTPEGYAFQKRAAEAGFKRAVYERDLPFGDARGPREP
jgi:enoyl-CoA hydratase/carnithine racemase